MTANKKKIAITGGIGSGKSSVLNIVSSLGYPSYSADKIYADIMCQPSVIKKASDLLGIKLIYVDEKPRFDRNEASKIVFSDKNKKILLENFVHPLVYAEIDSIFSHSDCSAFFEVPLLFESNRQNDFDCIIIVERELNARIKSVMERSRLTEDEVLLRIKNQFDYCSCNAKLIYRIQNNGDLSALKSSVISCVKKIIN